MITGTARTLDELNERLTAKLTPALNTGTALDALILVAEVIREMRAELAADPPPFDTAQARAALKTIQEKWWFTLDLNVKARLMSAGFTFDHLESALAYIDQQKGTK